MKIINVGEWFELTLALNVNQRSFKCVGGSMSFTFLRDYAYFIGATVVHRSDYLPRYIRVTRGIS